MSATHILTRKQAAGELGISPSTFDSWVRKGIVPRSLSGTRRWSRAALERALSGEPTEPVATNDNASPFEAWKRVNAR